MREKEMKRIVIFGVSKFWTRNISLTYRLVLLKINVYNFLYEHLICLRLKNKLSLKMQVCVFA